MCGHSERSVRQSRLAWYSAESISASTSDGSDSFTFTSQPSPYGSSLIVSGLSASASLTAVDLARQRREHVGDRLHRLDLGVRLVLGDLRADVRRVEEHDLAERILRVPGDPEGGGVPVNPCPVVLGVVLQVVRIAGVGHVVTLPFCREACARSRRDGPGRARRSRSACPRRHARWKRTPSRFRAPDRARTCRW